MANITGALGLEGLGAFLQNFAAARQQKALMQQKEDEFNQTIASRLAEMQAEQAKQQYEQYQKAQEQLRTNLEAGTIQNQFDPMGKLVGKTGARLTPEAVTRLNQALVTGLQTQGNPFIQAEAKNTPQPATPFINQNSPVLPFSAVAEPISPNAPTGFKPPTRIGLPGAFGLGPQINTETKETTKSEGQSTTDQQFGKFYAEQVTGGGVQTAQNVDDLQNVANDLRAKKVNTGGFAGTILPESAQRLVDKSLSDARSRVQAVVFPTLRQIMGANFTEQEGQRVINTTFDSSQPPEVNAQRAERLKSILQRQLTAQQDAIHYWENNGQTLKGYKIPAGGVFLTANQILNQLNNTPSKPQSSSGWRYIGRVK